MNRWQLIRVVACFLLVFALGGLTGWLLRPASSAAPEDFRSLSALERFDQRLDLSDEQEAALKPILEEWEIRAALAGRRPRRRLELLEHFAPLVREVLAPAQQAKFEAAVEEARTRLEERAVRNAFRP